MKMKILEIGFSSLLWIFAVFLFIVWIVNIHSWYQSESLILVYLTAFLELALLFIILFIPYEVFKQLAGKGK